MAINWSRTQIQFKIWRIWPQKGSEYHTVLTKNKSSCQSQIAGSIDYLSAKLSAQSNQLSLWFNIIGIINKIESVGHLLFGFFADFFGFRVG